MGDVSLLSLRSSSSESQEQEPLQDVITRIFEQHGHFRRVTENSMSQQLSGSSDAEATKALDAEDEDDNDEGDGNAKTREELYASKANMVNFLNQAQNETLTALDLVSMLISKDAPKQGLLSMSPFLKQNLPTGSLQTDNWRMPRPQEDDKQQSTLSASGRKLRSLQSAADRLLTSAQSLEREIHKETEYWAQVLSVNEKGWYLCKLRRAAQTLAVRIGSSEALGEFKDRNLAALAVEESGKIKFERDEVGKSKALRVRIEDDHQTLGISSLPLPIDIEETALEHLLQRARDGLFDGELHQEILREAQEIASLGIEVRKSALIMPCTGLLGNSSVGGVLAERIVVDTVSTRYPQEIPSASTHDKQAQIIAQVFRASLLQVHHLKLLERSALPPPLKTQPRPRTANISILRPIMTYSLHRATMAPLSRFLGGVRKCLGAAGLSVTVSYTTRSPFSRTQKRDQPTLEDVFKALSVPWETEIMIVLPQMLRQTKPKELLIKVTTSLIPPSTGSELHLEVPIELTIRGGRSSEGVKLAKERFIDNKNLAEYVYSCVLTYLLLRVKDTESRWELAPGAPVAQCSALADGQHTRQVVFGLKSNEMRLSYKGPLPTGQTKSEFTWSHGKESESRSLEQVIEQIVNRA